MSRSEPSGSSGPSGWVFAIAIAVAFALKLVLLFTSQSMADGDEAVEGLMALHILADGVHPIYPYGVNYGAGAGVEAHWAAAFFAIFGPSSIALKAVGLCFWLVSRGFLYAIAQQEFGRPAARSALVLWGLAPFATEWSLKVAGGHNVAVSLVLLALWLGLCREKRYAAVCLLPLAAIAHPVVLPVVIGVAAALLVRSPSGERIGIAGALALTTGVALALLWPGSETVWNPASRGFDWLAIVQTIPHVAGGLFTANLNGRSVPGGWDAAVALVWGAAALAALFTLPTLLGVGAGWRKDLAGSHRDAIWWLPVLASLAVLLIVQPDELAARHLLPVLPILCLLLGRWLARPPRRSALATGLVLAALAASGALVQLRGVAAPAIHGAGPHGQGIDRQNVRDLLSELERDGVRHVYTGDAMLQWMLVFESQERVIARWREPLGRVPRYPREVDRAQRAGSPVRLVVVTGRPESGAPLRFEVRPLPGAEWLQKVFPPAPES